MERVTLLVLVPAVKSEQCSESVHQTDETSGITSEETGRALHYLPG